MRKLWYNDPDSGPREVLFEHDVDAAHALTTLGWSVEKPEPPAEPPAAETEQPGEEV